MNQETVKSSLNKLERSILTLLKERKDLQKKIDDITLENHELKANIQAKKDLIAHFENQVKTAKIADHINAKSEGETQRDEMGTELKREVEKYIREIDKCITSKYLKI